MCVCLCVQETGLDMNVLLLNWICVYIQVVIKNLCKAKERFADDSTR